MLCDNVHRVYWGGHLHPHFISTQLLPGAEIDADLVEVIHEALRLPTLSPKRPSVNFLELPTSFPHSPLSG